MAPGEAMVPSAASAASTAALDAQLFKVAQGETANKRNIPEAIFIENIEAMCNERSSAEVVARLQELYTKYQYMQTSLLAQRSSLKTKLPDITSALETVNHLSERRDKESEAAEYTYQLCENIYARAAVPPTNVVCLWLGANCMLEYTLEEAVELLTTNEVNAKTTLKSVEEDMAFMRDQLTTTEVNIARAHNYGVKLRQQQTAKDQAVGVAAGGEAAPAPAAAPAVAPFAPPQRAGGQGPGHVWKQQAEEVEVSVEAPAGAQKGDIKVTITAEALKVEHAGKVLLEGALAARCSPGGSTWTINEGRVEVTLEKAEAKQWKALFEDED